MASTPARERPQEAIQADSVSQRTTPAAETSSTPPSKGAIPKTRTSASNTPRSEPEVIIIENDPEEVENPAEDPLPWWATEEENRGETALPTEEVRPMPVRQDNLPIRTDWDFEPRRYNWDSPNHRRQQCPERRITVCFSCGLKGATSKTCPHCGDKWRAASPYVPSLGRNVPRHELQAQAPRQDTDAATPAAKNRGKHRKNPPAAKPPRPAKTSRTGRGGPPPSPPPRREESWDCYPPSYDQCQESRHFTRGYDEFDERPRRTPIQYHRFQPDREPGYQPRSEDYPPLARGRGWGRSPEDSERNRDGPRRGRGGLPDPRYETEPWEYPRSMRDDGDRPPRGQAYPQRGHGGGYREEGPRHPPPGNHYDHRDYDRDYSPRGPEPPPPGYC
ncbi:serine/arginine repetitive matrix protein 1-like [Diachasma alloeum]|uniref:serine/arginine repetitive matrix protein 1-like n=1 Tax=Diachasma alloeum TaxID=454923 RepID=UPI0007383073|nr:serine/arginine repetitive matrix protein 1-like [Diachasma alloeum]